MAAQNSNRLHPSFHLRGVVLACGVLVLALVSVRPAPLAAQAPATAAPASIVDAIRNGDATIRLRYRFESVSDERFSKDARASTLRTTLDYRSQLFRGWGIVLEAENVTDLGAERLHNNLGFGDLGNGIVDRPVIADPEITEFNQAYLRLVRGETEITAGRRELNWGDQRFVGSVGWRQNHQTLDGVTIESRSIDGLALRYSFVDNVNRIFGDNHPSASHLANAAWALDGIGTLTAYGYVLDYDRAANAALSTSTYGIELVGERTFGRGSEGGELTWLYEGEIAQQKDSGDNPNRIDAGYRHARVGLGLDRITVEVGWELLAASRSEGRFITPLATLHKWNGWADKFLSTPPLGLDDRYVRLSGPLGPVKWTLVYHRFAADETGIDYGSEIDAQILWQSAWNQTFGLKGAFYDADRFSTDTDKLMVWTGYSF